MPLPNRVSAVLPGTDLETILGDLSAAKQKVPFLVEVPKGERKRMVRIDGGAQPWSMGMLEAATQHPGMIPGNFDLQEMRNDVVLWGQLLQIQQALTSLKQLVNDTCDAVAVDAYSAALAVYRIAKDSGVGMEGVENLMDEFGRRFARRSSRSEVTADGQ